MSRPLKLVAMRAIALVAISAAIGACSLNTDVSQPAALIRYAGDAQTAPPLTLLPTSLTVLVVNQFGERLKNVNVTWSIESGGGTLSATSAVSDESGLASVDYTTGPNAGNAIIHAAVHDLLPLSFGVTISPP